MTHSPKSTVGLAFLAGVAALFTFLFMPRPEMARVDTAPIQEAIQAQGTGTERKIDSLATLLTDTTVAPPGSISSVYAMLDRIERVESDHQRVVEILLIMERRQRQTDGRVLLLLCRQMPNYRDCR